MDSMLLVEDLSDDDSSCDIYSNSTYNSFWSIEACGESPYSCTWSINTKSRDSLCTSIWSSDSICSDSSYRSIGSSKTYSADSLCTSTVSTDTFSGSSFRSIWSITSLEGDLDFDTKRDFVVSKEEQFDDSNNIFVSLIKLSHHYYTLNSHKKTSKYF